MKNRVVLLSVLIISVVLISGCSQPSSPVNAVQAISAASKPGIVLMYTEATGIVTIPLLATDEDGQLEILPDTYDRDVYIAATGSGFIVTPDGYVITNAHVVSFEEEFIEKQLLEKAVIQEIDDYKKSTGLEPADDIIRFFIEYIYNYGRLHSVRTNTYAVFGVPQLTGEKILNSVPGDIKNIGTPSPGPDVAVIKLQNQRNLPTVKLGDSDVMQIGENIYPVGYPGVATFHDYLSQSGITEPTLTRGIISSERTTSQGINVFGTDAAITHGNSGGPVFNEKGEVIGISTFGSADEKQEVAGFNFIYPINLAKEYMNEINVQNRQGPVDTYYQAGLNAFFNKNYGKALEEFRKVKELFPAHPYVSDYITRSQQALAGAAIDTYP